MVNYLRDYQAPAFVIKRVDLTFELSANATRVTNCMQIHRAGDHCALLKLNGEQLNLLELWLNDSLLTPSDYEVDDLWLTIHSVSNLADFELTVVTELNPQDNTTLEGLYRSGGSYCTQCEAEGFRRITYYLDRPDVLSIFTTKIIADKATNPVLLSNGNLVEYGDLADGLHYAVWSDPFKKPCYLFALVAGNLEYLEDFYSTAEGRKVCLRIYAAAQHLAKCRHAMDSLIHSMRWDEERFGRSYDLDIYMIVAVDDFNMGAMENKGLNIFNSKYVLADPQTATDTDYEGVEAVIAHEYFHNWTGNRITCRDWFQLTLKEGLTVFRDQEFTADQLSPAVKRIEDVRRLRSHQFPEDAGPMSHPIQPQSYIEMNNFYTMTVYEKGAEVVRLYQTLLGRDGFREGMDLYFSRHDGQAVTVEDFRQAMADANQVDLTQMHSWYVQAGTPRVKVRAEYNAVQYRYSLHLSQTLPGQVEFDPFIIPLKMGLLSASGQSLNLQPSAECAEHVRLEADMAVLIFNQVEQTFVFDQVKERPVPSLLRDFSAPIKLNYAYSAAELALLAQYDVDSFNRWEAVQRLALMDLMDNVTRYEQKLPYQLGDMYAKVFERLLIEALSDKAEDLALTAYALTLPDLTYLIEQYETVNIDAVVFSHRQMIKAIAKKFYQTLLHCYLAQPKQSSYVYAKQPIAQRLLKNRCLYYLVRSEHSQAIQLAKDQFESQANMTDVMAALEALIHFDSSETEGCLNQFYQRWRHEPLVLDKWFALQASSSRTEGLDRVRSLINQADFSYKNPNRVRSVIGAFARNNVTAFHQLNGKGYDWLAEQILILDSINPQVASRMVAPLTQWRRYDIARQKLMYEQLKRLETRIKSKDVYELVSKSLA